MVANCAVVICYNTSKDIEGRGIKFFSFPRDKTQRRSWVKLCGSPKDSKYMRICSEHFDPDVLHSLKCRLLGINEKNGKCKCVVPPNEIPTLKLPKNVEILKILNRHVRLKLRNQGVKNRKRYVEELIRRSDAGCDVQYTPEMMKNKKKSKAKNKVTATTTAADVNESEVPVAYPRTQPETIYIKIPQAGGECLTMKEHELLELRDPGDIDIYELSDYEPSIEDLCRICGNEDDNLLPIFSEEGVKMELQEKINLSLPITVDKDDVLPLQVCQKCVKKLQENYLLALMCQNADINLKRLIAKKAIAAPIEVSIPCNNELLTMEEDPLDVTNPKSAPATLALQSSDFIPDETDEESMNSEVNVKVHTGELPPSKLSFQFVKPVNQEKMPTVCRICQIPLYTVQSAKDHYIIDHKKNVCAFCFDYFETSNELVKHTNNSHLYKCLLCKFRVVGYGEKLLQNHIKKCHLSAPPKTVAIVQKKEQVLLKASNRHNKVMCKFCFQLFASKTIVKQHYLNVHQKHVCMFCSEDYKTAKELDDHEQLTSHIVICTICKNELNTPRGLMQHMSNAHPNGIYETFYCEICLGMYYTRSSLWKHYTQTHDVQPCMKCSSVFKTIQELQNHQKSEYHLDCHMCTASFDDFEEFMGHVNEHESLTCNYCKKSFTNKCNLKSHMKYYHEKKPFGYHCAECNRKFRNPLKLKMHMARHLNQRNFKCEICTKSFYDNIALKTHMTCHSDERKYVCEQCGVKFKRHRNLKQHVESVHVSWKYTCNVCKMICETEVDVIKHFNEHPEDDRNSTRGRPFYRSSEFKCDECEKYFATKFYLLLHKKRHEEKKEAGNEIFTCDLCDREFKSKFSLKVHINNLHSTEKPFKCTKCNKSYLNEARLNIHERIHTQIRKHICIHCQKEYPSNTSLINHVRNVHYNFGRFKCDICEKAFNQISHLKQHSVVHTGNKPHQCDICLQQFTQAGDMKRHKIKLHTIVQSDEFDIVIENQPDLNFK